jgi:hypothetical protein
MTDGSITPSSFLLGGLIALLTVTLPFSVVIPPQLTNVEENVKINKVS